MKKARLTEEQIIGILQEHGRRIRRRREARRSLPQACYVGGHLLCVEGEVFRMTVSEAKRLKALEDENAKLKKLLAEQMLDMAAMKELLSKKW